MANDRYSDTPWQISCITSDLCPALPGRVRHHDVLRLQIRVHDVATLQEEEALEDFVHQPAQRLDS